MVTSHFYMAMALVSDRHVHSNAIVLVFCYVRDCVHKSSQKILLNLAYCRITNALVAVAYMGVWANSGMVCRESSAVGLDFAMSRLESSKDILCENPVYFVFSAPVSRPFRNVTYNEKNMSKNYIFIECALCGSQKCRMAAPTMKTQKIVDLSFRKESAQNKN